MWPLSTPSGAVRHRMQTADLGTGAHTSAVRPRVTLARSATIAKSVQTPSRPIRRAFLFHLLRTQGRRESSVRRIHGVAKGRPHRFRDLVHWIVSHG
jgi:hypothetical protein